MNFQSTYIHWYVLSTVINMLFKNYDGVDWGASLKKELTVEHGPPLITCIFDVQFCYSYAELNLFGFSKTTDAKIPFCQDSGAAKPVGV